MFFTCKGDFIGVDSNVSKDGIVYNNITFVEAEGNDFMKIGYKPETELVGFKSFEELPRYARCEFLINFIQTSKGNFFNITRVTLLKK